MAKTGPATATKAWLKSPHRHDIDTAAEQVLQKDEHAHMTVKRGGSLELGEHVNVRRLDGPRRRPQIRTARTSARRNGGRLLHAGQILRR
jgi:hypothetical protein